MYIKDFLGKLKALEGCIVEKVSGGWYTISYENQVWEVKAPNRINVVKSDFLSQENYYMELDVFYERCITRRMQDAYKKNAFKIWSVGDKLLIKKMVSENRTVNQIADALEREVNPRLIGEICGCAEHTYQKHPLKEIPYEEHDLPILDLIAQKKEECRIERMKNYDPLDAMNL